MLRLSRFDEVDTAGRAKGFKLNGEKLARQENPMVDNGFLKSSKVSNFFKKKKSLNKLN